MIGNDIVDMAYSAQKSDWKRPGYLQKIFSPKERDLINSSDSKEELVWRIWSMKESAYKAAFRNVPIRAFNPRKFDCSVLDEVGGEVLYNKDVYVTRSARWNSSMHTTAWLKGQNLSQLKEFLKDFGTKVSSHELYDFVLKKVALTLNCAASDLNLKKSDAGIPEIFKDDEKVKVLCSLSHHGTFGAVLIYS